LKIQKIVGFIIAKYVKKQLAIALQMFRFNHFIRVALKNHAADNCNITKFSTCQFRSIQTFLEVVKKKFRGKKIVVNYILNVQKLVAQQFKTVIVIGQGEGNR